MQASTQNKRFTKDGSKDRASSAEMSTIYFYSHVRGKIFPMLSNFYWAPFEAPDPAQWLPCKGSNLTPSYADTEKTRRFVHSEQYLMYAKALQFGDQSTADAVLEEKEAGVCKALGRRVRGFDDDEWAICREVVMEEALWYKFGGGDRANGAVKLSSLGQKLLETGERELVEASPRDRTWGIGFAAAFAENCRQRWGQNLLGKCLERVRDRLRRQERQLEVGTLSDGEATI